MHSTTKYCGGHSDVVGGALVIADDGLGDDLAFHQNAIGAIAGPFDAWLVLRGLRTLGVRMDRHCDNAERIVDQLVAHPRVTEVFYPGLRRTAVTRWRPSRCVGSAEWSRSASRAARQRRSRCAAVRAVHPR